MDDGILTINGKTYISSDKLVGAMLEASFDKYDVGDNRISDCERDAIEYSLDLLDHLGLPDRKKNFKIRWFHERFIKDKEE